MTTALEHTSMTLKLSSIQELLKPEETNVSSFRQQGTQQSRRLNKKLTMCNNAF